MLFQNQTLPLSVVKLSVSWIVFDLPCLQCCLKKRRTPSKGLKRGKGATASEPQNITATTRVREFPDQCLSNKLFCDVCREPLSHKKSVISLHLKSAKHATGVDRIKAKNKREKNNVDLLKKYDQEVHPVGEGLPNSVHVVWDNTRLRSDGNCCTFC